MGPNREAERRNAGYPHIRQKTNDDIRQQSEFHLLEETEESRAKAKSERLLGTLKAEKQRRAAITRVKL